MNILFVYPTVFLPKHGGVERVTHLLSNEFKHRGHKIYHLHTHTDNNSICSDFSTLFFPSPNYNDPINIPFYHRIIKENNIDIIINQCGAHHDSVLFNNVGGTKAKVISVIHFAPKMFLEHYWSEVSTLRDNSLKEKIKRIGRCIFYTRLKNNYLLRLTDHYRWLFDHTDKICILSEQFKKELEDLSGDKYCPSKVISINNPVEIPPKLNHNRENMIIWVGRFDLGQKRPDLCLKIWDKVNKMLPEWELVMIGDGKDFRYIKEKAKNIERISFTGYADPEPYYNRAKVLMMTSTTEGWGMVLTEAMAHGVIPMAFDSFLAVRDIISDDKLLIKPFDIDEYARKLTLLVNDDNALSNALSKVNETLERFSLSRTADKWENLFNSLLSDKNSTNI